MKLIGCSIIGLFMLFSGKCFSQHYADLAPGDKTATTKKVKKSIVSFGFFSPLNQHISFGYDQLLGTDIILSSQIGIIGPGVTQTTNPSKGGFLEIGPKLFFSPTWTMDGMRRMNAMQGGYFKPEIVVSAFSQSNIYIYYPQPPTTSSTTYTGIAIILNLGHQWIFANSFALDMYFGIGYNISAYNSSGTGNNFNNEANGGNYYSYETGGSSFPLAFAAGLNLGVPF